MLHFPPGVKSQTTATTLNPSTLKPKAKDACFSRMSAIFLAGDKKTYMFSSDKLWILDKHLALEKGPIYVEKVFKGIKSVDAAFRRNDGKTVLFSGDR